MKTKHLNKKNRNKKLNNLNNGQGLYFSFVQMTRKLLYPYMNFKSEGHSDIVSVTI